MVLTKHCNPTPSEVMQIFRFNTTVRKPGGSVTEYVAELRRLAEVCDYGTTPDQKGAFHDALAQLATLHTSSTCSSKLVCLPKVNGVCWTFDVWIFLKTLAW